MAVRLYGQKLPPLSAKTKMVAREYSDDDKTFYTEDNEDVPLLSRSITGRKLSDNVNSITDNYTDASTSHKHCVDDRDKLHYNSIEDSNMSSRLIASGRTTKSAACIETHHSNSAEVKSSSCNGSRKTSTDGTDTLHYSSTEVTNMSSSLSSTRKPLFECDDFADSFSNASPPLPSDEKVDNRCEESVSFEEDKVILSIYEADKDPKIATIGPETFELHITKTLQCEGPKLSTMCRSMSSTENSQLLYVYDDQKSQTQERKHRMFKLNHKRSAIPRSQSQPLATDEDEYSKYWRGEVTVIKMQTEELPKSKSEQTLDEKMATSAITRSIIMGNNRLVLECLKQGENPHLMCTKTGRSYFHVVASTASIDHELKWVPIVYQFSNVGVAVDTKDVDGQTAVRIAIKRRLVQILAALLKCGAEFDAADEYHSEQVTGGVKSEMMEVIRRLTPSYWSAIDNFTHFKVNRLIRAWSRVNISKRGQTLIEYAKHNSGDAAVVKLLIQNEASIDLAHAVIAGDAERVKVVLCDGAVDLATTDTSVKHHFAPMTLLDAAIKYDHQNVVKVLQEASKPKFSIFTRTDPNLNVSRASIGETVRVSPFQQDNGQASSVSTQSHAIYYGNSIISQGDSESVTSTMCALL